MSYRYRYDTLLKGTFSKASFDTFKFKIGWLFLKVLARNEFAIKSKEKTAYTGLSKTHFCSTIALDQFWHQMYEKKEAALYVLSFFGKLLTFM